MARDYAKTNLTIWQDPEWRALPWPAQHAYKMFWEHPGLSYCGVVDWRPSKMLGWGAGLTRADFDLLTDCLRARHFLVVDEATEECLVRSWVRFDGLIRQPRLAVSMCNAFGEVGSNDLRGVIVDELAKLKEREPDAAGWAKPQTADLLGFPRVSAKTLSVPEDPFATGFGITLGSVSVPVSEAFGPNPTSGFGTGLGTPYNSNSTITTTPVVAEVPNEPKAKKTPKKPETPLSADWAPNEQHARKARERGLDLELAVDTFRNHAAANDRRQVDWDASFHTWLNRERPATGSVHPLRPAGEDPNAWMRRTL